MSQRTVSKHAFKSSLPSPTKVKKPITLAKRNSDLDDGESKTHEWDDFDKKTFKAQKKGEGPDTTRSAIRALNQPSVLRERAVQSIQQHVDRIQTGSSLETLNRNHGALAALS